MSKNPGVSGILGIYTVLIVFLKTIAKLVNMPKKPGIYTILRDFLKKYYHAGVHGQKNRHVFNEMFASKLEYMPRKPDIYTVSCCS